MAAYDADELKIARQRAIAKALRESGNVSFDPAASAGRLVYARSPLEDIAKVVNQGLSGYAEHKGDVLADALMKRRNADTQAGISGSMDALVGKSQLGTPGGMADGVPMAPVSGGTVSNPMTGEQAQVGDELNSKRASLAAALRGMDPEQAASMLQSKVVDRALPARQPLMQISDGGSIFDPNQNAVVAENIKDARPAPALQKTDSGLTFNSVTGEYRDSDGKVLTSEQVAAREAKLAGNRAAATTSATDKAKLDALPVGGVDAMVEEYMQTGKTPAGVARNPLLGFKFWAGVQDRATKDGKPLAMQVAETRTRAALAPAMSQTQKQLAANSNFLETLHKNVASADEFAKRVGGDDSPFMNDMFNKWKRHVTGDPDVAQFDVFNNAIVGESAKISSGGVGSVSASSDTQMQKNAKLLSSAQNYKQWRAAANAMQQEGDNRISSIKNELESLTAASANTGPAAPPAPPPVVPPAAPTTKVIGGKTYVKKGNDWEEQ